MFVLEFNVDGDVQLSRAFSRFADHIKDMRPAFEEIVKLFYQMESQQFESEGAHGSGGWAPLAPSTLEQKLRMGYPSKMLVRSGKLMLSLTGQASGSVVEVRPLMLAVGTSIPYGVFHQRGTAKMPARPLIQLSEDDKTKWHKTIHKYIVEKAKEDGLL